MSFSNLKEHPALDGDRCISLPSVVVRALFRTAGNRITLDRHDLNDMMDLAPTIVIKEVTDPATFTVTYILEEFE